MSVLFFCVHGKWTWVRQWQIFREAVHGICHVPHPSSFSHERRKKDTHSLNACGLSKVMLLHRRVFSGILWQLKKKTWLLFFSAPEPKAQVHYCDHALSVVRPSLTFHIFNFSSETTEQNSTKLDREQDLNIPTRWPPWPLIGWDIFDFSSETAKWNSTKLDRKQDLNVLYQVCVF